MQFIKTTPNVDLAENIVETPGQVVTHLVIPAGKAVPKHHVSYSVIVAPGEWHDLKAVEDTEVMVIKSRLAD